jgi:uncharacterized membrane protein YqjE
MDAAPPEPKPTGPDASMRGLSEPLLRYLEARGVLLSIEARESLQQIVRVMILVGMAGSAAFTGWLLLTASLISLIMEKSGWTWEKTVTVLGASHLLIAVVFLLAMRGRLLGMRWFADTLNEFKKDRAWLARQPRKP